MAGGAALQPLARMAAGNPTVYYKLLGLEPGTVDQAALRRAYRQAALKWHPDKNPENKKKAEDMFKRVSEAYSVLLFLSWRHGEASPPRRLSMQDREAKAKAEKSATAPRSRLMFSMDDAFQVFEDFFGANFDAMEGDDFFGGGGRRASGGAARAPRGREAAAAAGAAAAAARCARGRTKVKGVAKVLFK